MDKQILKNFILLGFALMVHMSLLSQTSKNKLFSTIKKKDIMDMQYETFDMEYYERKKNLIGNIFDDYTKEDGTQVSVWGKLGSSFVILEVAPAPYFYTRIKLFYGDGKLQEKGIKLPEECRIGKWLECDEQGNCQIIDYDKGMGKFNYNDVLNFLDKRGYINLETGEGRGKFSFGYSYENKTWGIVASKNNVHFKIFRLSGKSGKILEEKDFVLKD